METSPFRSTHCSNSAAETTGAKPIRNAPCTAHVRHLRAATASVPPRAPRLGRQYVTETVIVSLYVFGDGVVCGATRPYTVVLCAKPLPVLVTVSVFTVLPQRCE